MDQQEELERDARRLGEYLALLLEVADIPEQDKIAFAAMLPHLNPEQIDQLIKTLEQNVKDNTQDIPGLKEKIEEINNRYAAQEQKIIDDTMKSLEDVEAFLKNGGKK